MLFFFFGAQSSELLGEPWCAVLERSLGVDKLGRAVLWSRALVVWVIDRQACSTHLMAFTCSAILEARDGEEQTTEVECKTGLRPSSGAPVPDKLVSRSCGRQGRGTYFARQSCCRALCDSHSHRACTSCAPTTGDHGSCTHEGFGAERVLCQTAELSVALLCRRGERFAAFD